MNKKIYIFIVFCITAFLITGCKSLNQTSETPTKQNTQIINGIDPEDMPENNAPKQENDFSCKGIDTSKINKTTLKKVLTDMANMERNVTKGREEFEDFSDYIMKGNPEGFYYDHSYSNPGGFGILVKHEGDNQENLVIYGPLPKIRFHHCVVPVSENPDLSFCCAVQELNNNYVIRQYKI